MKNLKNINVLLENTGASQISFCVISELNNLTKTHPNIDPIVFYEDKHKNCLPANFAVMQISEAWGQLGPIIATSFSTARSLCEFPSSKRFFYVWDLEWIRDVQLKKYEEYRSVYSDESLSLIARSDHHKKAIENAFNREVKFVVSDFDIKHIMEVIGE